MDWYNARKISSLEQGWINSVSEWPAGTRTQAEIFRHQQEVGSLERAFHWLEKEPDIAIKMNISLMVKLETCIILYWMSTLQTVFLWWVRNIFSSSFWYTVKKLQFYRIYCFFSVFLKYGKTIKFARKTCHFAQKLLFYSFLMASELLKDWRIYCIFKQCN